MGHIVKHSAAKKNSLASQIVSFAACILVSLLLVVLLLLLMAIPYSRMDWSQTTVSVVSLLCLAVGGLLLGKLIAFRFLEQRIWLAFAASMLVALLLLLLNLCFFRALLGWHSLLKYGIWMLWVTAIAAMTHPKSKRHR